MSSNSDDNELNKGLNDQEFDEYLRRESAVSQRYRDLATRDVPSALEQRILRQAQTARSTRKSGTPRWLQWGAPLAVAASALLTVAVLLRTTPQDTALQAPAVQPAAEPPAMESTQSNEAPLAALPESLLVESDELRDAATESRRNTPGPSGPARARSPADTAQLTAPALPPPASRRDTKAESSNIESLSRSASDDKAKASGEAAQPASAAEAEKVQYSGGQTRNYATYEPRAAPKAESKEVPSPAQKPAAAPVDKPVETPPATAIQSTTSVVPPKPPSPDPQLATDRKVAPETLLEQVRELRAQGKVEEAEALFKRLRAAYPEFPVPPEDLPQ